METPETTIEDDVRPQNKTRETNWPALETAGQEQRGLYSPDTCSTAQARNSHKWGRHRPNTYGRGPNVAYANPQYLIHVAMLIIRKDNNQL